MKGLELAEKYFDTYGRPMLSEQFHEIADQAAAGLVGYGSECLGFDDEISGDHDYGPSFCIWLPREIYMKYGKKLQAAYDALPKEFMGVSGRVEEEQGKGRVGALCLEDFYQGILGRDSAPETESQWLAISEPALCTAVNGQVLQIRWDGLRRFARPFFPITRKRFGGKNWHRAWQKRLRQGSIIIPAP